MQPTRESNPQHTCLTGVDALSRALPSFGQVPEPRPDRYVGIFYFLWLGQHGTSGPHDITRTLAEAPDAPQKPEHPLWGPWHAYHFWGEPLFGYYLTDDAWVLRRHIQMLTTAGVDFLMFDTTNAVTYKPVYQRYTDDTGRNDFGTLKVACDDEFLYFYARTAQAISPHTDRNWMLLFLNADGDPRTGWEGQPPAWSAEGVSFSLFEDECLTGLPACAGSHASRPWVKAIRGLAQDCQLN